jgi:ubiquitin-activating enzyme E1
MATTTSIVAGLVALELYKVVQNITNVESYRDSCFNLAIPFFASSDPVECKKQIINNKEYTLWDKIEYYDSTIGDFITKFEKEYCLEIEMITYKTQNLYSFVLSPKKQNERKKMTIRQCIETYTKRKLKQKDILIEVSVIDLKDEDIVIDFPFIKITI